MRWIARALLSGSLGEGAVYNTLPCAGASRTLAPLMFRSLVAWNKKLLPWNHFAQESCQQPTIDVHCYAILLVRRHHHINATVWTSQNGAIPARLSSREGGQEMGVLLPHVKWLVH